MPDGPLRRAHPVLVMLSCWPEIPAFRGDVRVFVDTVRLVRPDPEFLAVLEEVEREVGPL